MSTESDHLEKAARRLRVAKRLQAEGEYEDAVSRAYYAMYHAAMASFATVDIFPRTHTGTITEFGRRFVLSGILPRELGRSLAELKAARETYEYDPTTSLGREEAEILIDEAERFVNKIMTYLEERKHER